MNLLLDVSLDVFSLYIEYVDTRDILTLSRTSKSVRILVQTKPVSKILLDKAFGYNIKTDVVEYVWSHFNRQNYCKTCGGFMRKKRRKAIQRFCFACLKGKVPRKKGKILARFSRSMKFKFSNFGF